LYLVLSEQTDKRIGSLRSNAFSGGKDSNKASAGRIEREPDDPPLSARYRDIDGAVS